MQDDIRPIGRMRPHPQSSALVYGSVFAAFAAGITPTGQRTPLNGRVREQKQAFMLEK